VDREDNRVIGAVGLEEFKSGFHRFLFMLLQEMLQKNGCRVELVMNQMMLFVCID